MRNYIVIIVFSIIFVIVLSFITQKKHLGKSPINRCLFFLGKFSMFVSWIFFFIKALFPNYFQLVSPIFFEWIAVSLLLFAIVIELLAFFTLGKLSKFGLPEHKSVLITKGVYRISRNPMYVAFDLICIASSIFHPNIINIGFSIIGIVIHHKIILGEENFLKTNYCDEWYKYEKRTRRYL
ncbi:MAG: isoprenylcysteine carboxylmethyltransferase family protein [Bacteroidetes bacterium]|nr:isoprenylcysteine carboxylmethyltransferase family protein [Bacteroidota bacterium]